MITCNIKPYVSFILFLTFFACKKQKVSIKNNSKRFSFYVGTYTKEDSQGIYKYHLQNNGILQKIGLAASANNPSFLALSQDKKFLIAANETNSKNGKGTLSSFLIKKDTLIPINKSSSGGAHPCFVSTNKFNFVLTANYSSGSIGLLHINNKGELSTLLDLEQHNTEETIKKQKTAHAHSAWFDFNGIDIISVDLGTDEIWFSTLDTLNKKLNPKVQGKLKLPSGSGPRHLVYHPNQKWIYVVNELYSTVTLLQKKENNTIEIIDSFSTLPQNYTETNDCADIHISDDGKFVYASNRGHNSIAIFEVNKHNGTLKRISNETTLGESPRNFSLSPNGEFIVVANQITNNIVAYKRNIKTGLLQFTSQIEAPTPVCILFQNK